MSNFTKKELFFIEKGRSLASECLKGDLWPAGRYPLQGITDSGVLTGGKQMDGRFKEFFEMSERWRKMVEPVLENSETIARFMQPVLRHQELFTRNIQSQLAKVAQQSKQIADVFKPSVEVLEKLSK